MTHTAKQIAIAALSELADVGLRCDMNPTHDMSSEESIEMFWHDYLRRVDESLREFVRHKLALAATAPEHAAPVARETAACSECGATNVGEMEEMCLEGNNGDDSCHGRSTIFAEDDPPEPPAQPQGDKTPEQWSGQFEMSWENLSAMLHWTRGWIPANAVYRGVAVHSIITEAIARDQKRKATPPHDAGKAEAVAWLKEWKANDGLPPENRSRIDSHPRLDPWMPADTKVTPLVRFTTPPATTTAGEDARDAKLAEMMEAGAQLRHAAYGVLPPPYPMSVHHTPEAGQRWDAKYRIAGDRENLRIPVAALSKLETVLRKLPREIENRGVEVARADDEKRKALGNREGTR